MLSKISIKLRISITLAFLALLLVVVGLVGQIGTRAGELALEKTYSEQLASAIALGDSKYNLALARVTMDRVLLQPNSKDTQIALTKASAYLKNSREAYDRYLTLPHVGDESTLAADVSEKFGLLLSKAIDPALNALQRGDVNTGQTIVVSTAPPLALALTKSSEALNQYLQQQGAKSYADFHSELEWIKIASAATIIFGIVVAILSAFLLQRAIATPLTKVLAACSTIAKGDLTRSIQSHSQDEMGELIQGITSMRNGLRETVSAVREGSQAMSVATQQIASGNSDLSQRTESQAVALQQTATRIEYLTEIVKQNNERAREASSLAIKASDIAVTGGDVMTRVIETMDEINRQSISMTDIITTIEAIAFQTNILALNAAVEAARAGEQGRGFAVVASEVRVLAQRSASAAKEIKALIQTAGERVNGGAELVSSAGTNMRDIVQSIKSASDIMSEVATASREQSDGIEQVNLAVSQMDEATQRNAALVEQTTAAAISLDEQAQRLLNTVMHFRT